VTHMETAEFQQGFESLARLADKEYHQTLAEVSGDDDRERASNRLGRLVGVTLKEPFATSEKLPTPSYRSAAYREWNLVPKATFEEEARTATWQYKVLADVKSGLGQDDPYLRDLSMYDFARRAHNETGFFGFFAQAVRRYVCGDPEIRAKVESAIEESRKSGTPASAMSPEVIAASGGAALGTSLIAAVPFLGFVGVPVIVALVLILYRLGVEGFCEWSDRLRTDEDEKY